MGAFSDLGNWLDDAGSSVRGFRDLISRDTPDPTGGRTYLEDGFIRNVRPQLREVLWQAPNTTIVIKKRAFSSLAENYNLDLLEEKEKLFYRATKKLFQNKAKALAAYERLTKIEKISSVTGRVNSHLMPTILNSVAELEDQGLFNIFDNKTQCAIQRLRNIDAFSDPTEFSQWWVEPGQPFNGTLGAGTGSFDLTVLSSVRTTTSVKLGGGGCSIELQNPYDIMLIGQADITRAIVEATNFTENSGAELERTNDNLIQTLNNLRLGTRQGDSENNLDLSLIGGQGNVFSSSLPNQPPITFTVQPTFRTRPVRAFIEQLGIVIPYTYVPGLVPVVEVQDIPQLTAEERRLVEIIIGNYITLIDLQTVQRFDTITFNKNVNYVRRKMTLHYDSKSMIQPMDIVNIFMTSNTQSDGALTSGMGQESTGSTLAGKINGILGHMKTTYGRLDEKNGTTGKFVTQDELEKIAVAGPGFPNWMWREYKGALTSQPEGLAVFVGVVKEAESSYRDGEFQLSVSCGDNSEYFDHTQVNINPSLNVPNGDLLDPLTPFNVSFDAVTGLAPGGQPEVLPENQTLLDTKVARVYSGRWRGYGAITQDIFNSRDGDISGSSLQEILATPAGFVYRWKEGIGGWVGSGPSTTLGSRSVQPRIVTDPFAGQDVMNALSLLVTAQPYNFNLFLQNAMQSTLTSADAQGPDSNTGDFSAKTFLESLLGEVRRLNSVWGGFLPFKSLVIGSAAETAILTQQAQLVTESLEINRLLTQQAALIQALIVGSPNPTQISNQLKGKTPENVPTIATSQATSEAKIKLGLVQNKLDERTAQFVRMQRNLNEANLQGGFKILGNNILYDPVLSPAEDTNDSVQKEKSQSAFRDRLGFLTLRRIWQVRANFDKNYFVVDDQYDKNGEIQAFERKVNSSNMKLFESEYTDLKQKMIKAAEVLGLEVFASTQGHIVARPPLYNRIPSSVLNDLFLQTEETGIQFFPEFFQNLFVNQGQTLLRDIEVLETQIRIIGVILGFARDAQTLDVKLSKFLSKSVADGSLFAFITTVSGNLADFGLEKLFTLTNPDMLDPKLTDSLDALSRLRFQAGAREIFPVTNQVEAFTETLNIRALSETLPSESEEIIRVLSNKYLLLTQQQAPIDEWVKEASTAPGRRHLISNLAEFINTRQTSAVSAANVVKNIQELADFNRNPSKAIQTASFPNLNSKSTLPSVIEHMIEKENNDELGPGSGQRFIIKDVEIISWSLEEKAPDYNTVLVTGKIDTITGRIGGQVEAPPGLAFKSSPGNVGGNLMTTAMAVDYDMWRMYGLKTSEGIEAPFFGDAESQCLPYAVYLLNLQRRNIFRGSITLRGNEYYQPGDVVFIESRGMLFYVEKVSHSLGFNRSFQTTLTLTYGRKPGEFIPTMLDMVGQLLYAPAKRGQFQRSSRFNAEGKNVPLALGGIAISLAGLPSVEEEKSAGRTTTTRTVTIVTTTPPGVTPPPIVPSTAAQKTEAESRALVSGQILNGPLGLRNQNIMQGVLSALSGELGVTNKTKNIVIIRTFTTKRVTPERKEIIEKGPEVVKQWLLNPTTFCEDGTSPVTSDTLAPLRLSPDNIQIVITDLDAEGAGQTTKVGASIEEAAEEGELSKFRFFAPVSAQAWGAARLLSTQGSFARVTQAASCEGDIPSANELLKTLVSQVIELWLVKEAVIPSIERPQNQSNPSQASQDDNLAMNEAGLARAEDKRVDDAAALPEVNESTAGEPL